MSRTINLSQLLNRPLKIAVLLDAALSSHCKIMRGISAFIEEHQLPWNVVLNHELSMERKDILSLHFDGIIANFSNPKHLRRLEKVDLPVVGLLNGLDHVQADQIQHPFVTIDNQRLVQLCYDHLRKNGLDNIAYYGLKSDDKAWHQCRSHHYQYLQKRHRQVTQIYIGEKASFSSWSSEIEQLKNWVEGLKKPVGIIVSSDARARTLIGLCEENHIMVPDEVAIISIGDASLSEFFQHTSLSVVEPGYEELGYTCANLLNQQLKQQPVPEKTFVEPETITARESTKHRGLQDSYLLRAVHYIRNHAHLGIKSAQVVEFAGCSRTFLEELFRDQIGHTIHKEIHHVKFEKVKHLLIHTQFSIPDIAQKTGYPSHQYLYSLFQRELGITPNQYRLQIPKSEIIAK